MDENKNENVEEQVEEVRSADDYEAEIGSLKTENEELQKRFDEMEAEARKIKEMNFTLSRQLKVEKAETGNDYLLALLDAM